MRLSINWLRQYVDIKGSESRYGGSWANEIEVKELVKIIRRLKKNGIEYGEIAVLTPFRGQLSLINQTLKKEKLAHGSGDLDFENPNMITTGTVHRFQGGERKVVIFSHVISIGEPRFLNSRVNLLNVAVSRAQDRFVFVGALDALNKGTYTSILREHLMNSGQPLYT